MDLVTIWTALKAFKVKNLIPFAAVALVGFACGTYFGYDYGSTKAYNAEHAKTEDCTKLRAQDEKQTLELSNAGNQELAKGNATVSEAKEESVTKREAILSDHSKKKTVVKATVTSGSGSGITVPVLPNPEPEFSLPLHMIQTINLLLEASNATGFYSTDARDTIGLRDSAEVSTNLDGTQDFGSSTEPRVLSAAPFVGGSEILGTGIPERDQSLDFGT